MGLAAQVASFAPTLDPAGRKAVPEDALGMAQRKATGTRRVWFPAVVFGGLAAGICVRLFFLQVVHHDQYAALAREEQSASTTQFARRGSLLDRNGNALATSVDTWDIYISSRAWKDPIKADEAARKLGILLGIEPTALKQTIAEATSIDVRIAQDIEYSVGQEILAQAITGVVAHPNTNRVNPEGDLGASFLGFIGADNTGLAGLESYLNEQLQGRVGRVVFERDTTGDPIPYGHYIAEEPIPGADVVLTIDRYLQQLAEKRLDEAIAKHKAKGGSITIMDPHTGEILALASRPGLKYSELENLDLSKEENLAVLNNRPVTDLYEPGSVMKVVTAAAAIDAGVVTPTSGYIDNGETVIYDATLKNWNELSYGYSTMTDVLINSINTGAIYMARMLGDDRFIHYIDAFGFGQKSNIDLPGEATGIMRRPDDEGWTVVDTATQSFGQAISVTPIQMITAIAATINGGNLLTPHIVKSYVDADGTRREIAPEIRSQPISAATSAQIRSMLGQVVPVGHPAHAKLYSVGGKSGTANVPVTNGYNDVQIASFVGFAPLENPEIIILVKIDENADLLTGAAAAGPVFAKLADEVLTYMNVDPSPQKLVGSRP